MQTQQIKISKLKSNTGQIAGLPKNPRRVKSENYEKLKQSIIDDPEMVALRECIVFPFKNNFVVICGNQRKDVCKELGYKEIPCKILDADTSIEKLKAYAIKDNHHAGDWSGLGSWDAIKLLDWGISFEEKETTKVSFEATNPKLILITVELDSLAAQELLLEKLQKEGYNCWTGKKKLK